MQVLFLGRAPCTKETLPDFPKWRRVTRPPLVFRGLTSSQRTPGFWGVTDSYDIWHARLGHVSSGYIKKMQTLGLINNIDYSGLSKYQICATSKLTRKTCGLVTRETKLLELNHSDLGYLK